MLARQQSRYQLSRLRLVCSTLGAASRLEFKSVHNSICCTPPFGAHQHLVHNSIRCTPAFGAHQHLLHNSVWCTTAFCAHKHLVHTTIWCTPALGAHQHLVHTSIWCTLPFGAHHLTSDCTKCCSLGAKPKVLSALFINLPEVRFEDQRYHYKCYDDDIETVVPFCVK